MPFYPMLATGFLIAADSGADSMRFTGSCAAFKSRSVYLTAAHCVKLEEGESLFLLMQSDNGVRTINNIHTHDTSDIAIVVAEAANSDAELANQVFKGISDELVDGGDFVGFGYPMEGSERSLPIGRLFKGHFQRVFSYEPPAGGNRYFAGELSIPAPAGFSGGPISWSHRPETLTAIVTTNHDSYAVLDYIEEVDDHGKRYKEKTSRVVSYGIAAMLTGKEDWINEIVNPIIQS